MRGGGIRSFVIAATAISVVGAAIRIASARGELWLDEILSVMLARHAPTAWDLFATVHHDNNHVLMSLMLRAMGDMTSPLLLRAPSIVAGTLAIVVVGLLARERGRAESLLTMGLISLCAPLVQYSSEARGYAFAILWALLAWLVLAAHVARPRLATAAAFWICCALGMLSHLTLVVVVVGLGAWSVAKWNARGGWRLAALESLRCHAVPCAVVVAILGMTLPDLVVAGGPSREPWDVVVGALSLVGGGPRDGLAAWAVGAAIIGALILAIAWLRSIGDTEWILHAFVVFVGPLLLVIVAKPDFWAERYFLLPMTFALLLLARALSALARRGRSARIAVVMATGAMLAGHAWQDGRLAIIGRGSPMATLDAVAASRVGKPVTLAASNDFRARVFLLWREEIGRARGSGRIEYIEASQSRTQAADWWLIEKFDDEGAAVASPVIRSRNGAHYRLSLVSPHAGMSGWTWLGYERVDAPVR